MHLADKSLILQEDHSWLFISVSNNKDIGKNIAGSDYDNIIKVIKEASKHRTEPNKSPPAITDGRSFEWWEHCCRVQGNDSILLSRHSRSAPTLVPFSEDRTGHVLRQVTTCLLGLLLGGDHLIAWRAVRENINSWVARNYKHVYPPILDEQLTGNMQVAIKQYKLDVRVARWT